MAKFIEVTTKNGKRLINTDIIEEVEPNGYDGANLYLAFNCPHATEQDYVEAKESYSEIKKMLLGGAEDGRDK